MRNYDLDDRLIDFAVEVISICDNVKPTKAGNHLAGQLVRSGTSPSLNYGEAQGGESPKDFVHKLKIILKELRETKNCLRIIDKANLFLGSSTALESCLNECKELIAIFAQSIKTAQRNQLKSE